VCVDKLNRFKEGLAISHREREREREAINQMTASIELYIIEWIGNSITIFSSLSDHRKGLVATAVVDSQ